MGPGTKGRIEMTTRISINISHGSGFVKQDDIIRAETAALDYFRQQGVDPAEAQVAFRRHLEWEAEFAGIAATFAEAEAIANVALTKGWYSPDGASCEIEVWQS